MLLQSVVNFALGSARVLPAIEMLRDFSESAEGKGRARREAGRDPAGPGRARRGLSANAQLP